MNRRDHAVVLVLAIALVALAGLLAVPRNAAAPTADESAPEATMAPRVVYREGVVGVPESITPITARSRAERTLVGLVFSGLVKLGPGSTYEPDLAASWSADEAGKVWTFRIRDDAVWHDGIPVTADDVVFTVEALKNPDAAGAKAAAWADVTAEAVDERTVRLSFGTPIAGVLAMATQPLVPAHLLADVPLVDLASSDFARFPVGSGPFAITDIDEARATLVPASGVVASVDEEATPSGPPVPTDDSLATPYPQPSVGQPSPYLDELQVRFYADETALAGALRDGGVDAASGLSTAALDGLATEAGIERFAYPTTSLSSVLLNLRPGHKELRDPKVRAALLAAIDRGTLVSDVLDGNGTPANALVPPTSWAYDAASAGTIPYNPKAAAKGLQGAGWTKKGDKWVAPGAKAAYKLEVLSVPASVNPRLAAVAGYVRDAWKELGFDVRLVETRTPELSARLGDGDFTAAVVDIAMGLEPDLYPLLATTQVRTAGSNLSGYQDAALDPLLEAARKPGTEEERVTAWKALLAALAGRQPLLPLAWNEEVMLARGLEGVTPRLIADTGDRYWDVLAWRLAADR